MINYKQNTTKTHIIINISDINKSILLKNIVLLCLKDASFTKIYKTSTNNFGSKNAVGTK